MGGLVHLVEMRLSKFIYSSTETMHQHSFVNYVCGECGLLDTTLAPTFIVVGNNQNKQMTVSLTFADGTSRDLTVLYMMANRGEMGAAWGDIFTEEGVHFGSDYCLITNFKKYTIGYKIRSAEAVVGNFDADGDWWEIGQIAERRGMLVDSSSYENGVWTVKGKAIDGENAAMSFNDRQDILRNTIPRCSPPAT